MIDRAIAELVVDGMLKVLRWEPGLLAFTGDHLSSVAHGVIVNFARSHRGRIVSLRRIRRGAQKSY